MNEKREKQKEEEKVNKDRKMRSETIILRPEVPLLERLSTYAASDAYPFHMPGHKRQVKMGIKSLLVAFFSPKCSAQDLRSFAYGIRRIHLKIYLLKNMQACF